MSLVPPNTQEVDVAPIVGDWINVNPHTREFLRVVVAPLNDAPEAGAAGLSVRAYRAGGGAVVACEGAEVVPCVGGEGAEATSFWARHEAPAASTILAVNQKLGVFVLQACSVSSNGEAHFSREFFRRGDADDAKVPVSPGGEAGPVDAGALLGTWLNTNDRTRWITSFAIQRLGAALAIRARGEGTAEDWGAAPLTAYIDDTGEHAFHAMFEREGVVSTLVAYTNKRLVVVAGFHRAVGARAGLLCREFYYRAGAA